MVKRKSEWPEKDELVMCTVKKVFDQGAFLALDEYDGKEGMVHVSEITSGWVKNIRRHIREGQKSICRVLDVDPGKGHVDLSIRRVKDSQRSWKSQQWKREQKTENILEQISKRVDSDLETVYKKIGFPLKEKYGEIYTGFEEIAKKGRAEVKWLDVDDEWIKALMDLIKSSVEPPSVEVTGYIDIRCSASNGIELIKKALSDARREINDTEVDIDFRYVGSPTYSIKISAPSYKIAEKALQKTADKAICNIEEFGGTGEFRVERDE